MRDKQDEHVTKDRDYVEDDKCVAMSPTIHEHSTRIRVDCANGSAQRIVEADNENRSTDRLQVLGHKAHPKLFACADDKNGNEQDDEIAFEAKKISQPS